MEFKPRHAQPFTVEQAVLLDPFVITAEIARLQNSLAHLRDTQQQLQESVDSADPPDPEISQAIEENNVVILSQEERVSMLRLALELKGLVNQSNPHYDSPLPPSPSPTSNTVLAAEESRRVDLGANDGIFL
ncbi:hypothetical protein K439DRAFT_1359816 [Ramaria rubella]|nr:hypothetical protein K439DRAFT_1359816 [Ramaria rubella]